MAQAAEAIAPANDAPQVVGQEILIRVAEIDASGRLRPVDKLWAADLLKIMNVDGQDEAISVCRLPGQSGWKLIAGGHRHAAAELGGWEFIRAVEKSADALDRRRREVAENLCRKGLAPLERAAFVAELLDVLRAKAGIDATASPQSVAANARWQKALKAEAADASANIAHAYGFADQVGGQLDLSRRTIYSLLELHRRLLPDVAQLIRFLPVGKNAAQLAALARLPEAEQRAVAKAIAEGRAKTPGEALAGMSGKAKPSPDAKRLSAFVGSFQRMGRAERKAALKTLLPMLTAEDLKVLSEAADA